MAKSKDERIIMNEEEVQIDLMTLLHYILRKWRSIIVVMLIVGSCCESIFGKKKYVSSGICKRS